jgi:hypothetical protein
MTDDERPSNEELEALLGRLPARDLETVRSMIDLAGVDNAGDLLRWLGELAEAEDWANLGRVAEVASRLSLGRTTDPPIVNMHDLRRVAAFVLYESGFIGRGETSAGLETRLVVAGYDERVRGAYSAVVQLLRDLMGMSDPADADNAQN